MEQRKCDHCGNPDMLDYGVSDACWEQVVPEELQPKIVCLICFDQFSSALGVRWTEHLSYAKFKGEAGEFTWYP